MKLIRNIISGFIFALFLMFSQEALAQNADGFFHSGAQKYINSDLQGAIFDVQEGLNQFPDDPKLNALLEKLMEEQEQQQQQQQNQDQENQENQDQENQDNQQQNENQDEQEQQEQEQNQDENQEPQDQQQQQPMEPREISQEEAEKILQALAQKEKELLKEFKKKPQGSNTHAKDW